MMSTHPKLVSEGLYRLEALVDIGLAASPDPQNIVKAQLKGGLIQIY